MIEPQVRSRESLRTDEGMVWILSHMPIKKSIIFLSNGSMNYLFFHREDGFLIVRQHKDAYGNILDQGFARGEWEDRKNLTYQNNLL